MHPQPFSIWKQNIFLQNFYIYSTAPTPIFPIPPVCIKRTIHTRCNHKDQWTFVKKKTSLQHIVKFSQIYFLSIYPIREMFWYIFWCSETKTFINKNGEWQIPDLDRQIWISVQQPGRINAWWTYVWLVIGFRSSALVLKRKWKDITNSDICFCWILKPWVMGCVMVP